MYSLQPNGEHFNNTHPPSTVCFVQLILNTIQGLSALRYQAFYLMFNIFLKGPSPILSSSKEKDHEYLHFWLMRFIDGLRE